MIPQLLFCVQRRPQSIPIWWVISLFLAVALAPPVFGQVAEDLVFEPAVDLEAVLPQSSVYDIVEDRDGFLWFATREGVARWDGYGVRTWGFDPLDPSSLPGNIVRDIVQDAHGDVWATTQDYLEEPAAVARILGPRYTEVKRVGLAGASLALDPQGEPVFVTADSIFVWDHRLEMAVGLAARTAPGAPYPKLLLTSTGQLWIVGLNGIERCQLTEAECRFLPVPSLFLSPRDGTLMEDSNGHVWLGTRDGPAVLDEDGKLHYIDGAEDWPGGVMVDLAEDADGTLWALGEGGVAQFRHGVPMQYSPLPILGERTFLAPIVLFIDSSQNTWVGTVWGSYVRRRDGKRFGHLEHNPDDPNSLGSGLVTSFTEDHAGNLWVGTIGGGVNRWHRASGEVTRFRATGTTDLDIVKDIVWDLEVDREGTVWIGTGAGLGRVDHGANSIAYHYADSSAVPDPVRSTSNTINDLEIGPEGAVWISCPIPCADTLRTFDKRSNTYGAVSGDFGVTGYLTVGPNRNLWIGSSEGMRQLSLNTGEVTAFAPEAGNLDGVLDFLPTSNGLWVGANSGLYHFDESGNLVQRLTMDHGLPSNAVYGVVPDDLGFLWLSTNRGLARVNPNDPAVGLRVFDQSTGLRNLEFNRNAFLKAADGTLFFGGDRGVTYFRPETIRDNTFAPPVRITSLDRATKDGTEMEVLGGGTGVAIEPSVTTFTLHFTALSYTNPHRNQYRVTLDGFDDDWRDLGTTPEVTYTNVPPGHYTFRVMGANEDGVWGAEEAQISVQVIPWFYETDWFRALVVLLGLGMVTGLTYVVARSRYRVQLAAVRAAQEMERERGRISRDMHDEVGASLTEIAILSDRAVRESSEGPPGHAGRIGEKARLALDSIRGIIWATDPTNDEGRRVSAFLREYAADVLEAHEGRVVLEFPAPETVPRTTAAVRRTLLLVLKEALANVLQHAGATQIVVRLAVVQDQLALSVEDDGGGFDVRSDRAVGHGLSNMAHRAQESGGEFSVDSTPGQGTRVSIRVPANGEQGPPPLTSP